MLDGLRQDIRFALRTLARAPGFTVAAVGTLALGIGATALVFSIVHTMLLRPFPYAEPDRLVSITEADTRNGEHGIGSSYPNFVSWRNGARSLSDIAAYDERSMAMRVAASAELLDGASISANMFRTLGVEPVAGRDFLAEEDAPGAPRVLIISYELWQRLFNGSSDAVGATVSIGAEPHTIIGVMPPRFAFPAIADAWVPLRLSDTEDRGQRYLKVLGRLQDGVTIEAANVELASMSAQLQTEYPEVNEARVATALDMRAAMMQDVKPVLLILFGAVGFVLLIACANVANLMLARATSRDREMAIRGAIGAGGARLMRQLFTESLIIAVLGASAGTLFSAWWLDLIVSRLPEEVPFWMSFTINNTVLLFIAAIAAATSVVFGLAPALQVRRADLHNSLRDGARSTGGVQRARLRSAFVVAQLAGAIVLLVGSVLLVRSFVAMQTVDPGFDRSNILSMRIALPPARYTSDDAVVAFHDRMVAEVSAFPGVEAAALASWFPVSGSTQTSNFSIAGIGEIEGRSAYSQSVTADYFKAMGIPIVRGRAFDARDRTSTQPVAIINQKMADLYFPGQDPIGRGIAFGGGDPPMATIVGIAANVNQYDVDQKEIGVDIYRPLQQTPRLTGALVVRTRDGAAPVANSVRDRIRALDADIPVFNVMTVQEMLRSATWDTRFAGAMFGLFALGALLLSVIGLYGVISYMVEQRSHEIGVRVALGATRDQVMRLVFRQGMRLTAIGVVIGTALAFGLSRVLGNVLFGVSTTDPFTFTVVPALLAGVALLAMYVPARRATRVNPVTTLRGS